MDDTFVVGHWLVRRPSHLLTPERALFCEVIRLAYEDATKHKGSLQAEALEWLECSDDFDLVATLAGFDDPDTLRAGIMRRIDEMRPQASIKVPEVSVQFLGGRTLLTGLSVGR